MRRLMFLASLCLLASACAEASAAEPTESQYAEVLVAARDLPVGSVVTFDDLMVRKLTKGYLSTSVVMAEVADFINGQKVLLPILKGDLVHWSFFSLPDPVAKEIRERCPETKGNDTSAEEQVARARQVVLSRKR